MIVARAVALAARTLKLRFDACELRLRVLQSTLQTRALLLVAGPRGFAVGVFPVARGVGLRERRFELIDSLFGLERGDQSPALGAVAILGCFKQRQLLGRELEHDP